ncbi:MAG: DUF3341 domain-containing protein [candidate division KSB1 bacterium]|nr:DUF3341 domain-containing protein [candidate division KSB1 bacterium]MDQ7062797.1 DUF3341 domain-containing protein [candidate division KSB1 bacterium]
MSEKKGSIVGILAEFENPAALVKAASALRDNGFKDFDCYTPFPVHGMDRAMGLKRSKLGFVVGIMGLLGGSGGLLMQWWMSAVDYPLVISGKPFFSLPAFIPVVFELTVLLSAFGAVFGMWHFNRLPQLHHPVFYSERFSKATDDGFFVAIESTDPQFDVEKNQELFQSLGAVHIELLKEDEEEVKEEAVLEAV